MISKIDSKNNEKIKKVAKLSDAKTCYEEGLFKVEGFHNLEMVLKAKLDCVVYSTKEIESLPESVIQYIVSEEIMQKITKTKTPQGVVAVVKLLENTNDFADKVLYLDSVSDPGNLGTLLRTALAFSYKDVILGKGCCALYNDKVLQSAQGAIFSLNIVEDYDLTLLKGYEIIATEIKGSVELEDLKPSKKHVLVLGNEAHGVSQEILNIADKRVRININEIESLNVAIAGAIAMYKLGK